MGKHIFFNTVIVSLIFLFSFFSRGMTADSLCPDSPEDPPPEDDACNYEVESGTDSGGGLRGQAHPGEAANQISLPQSPEDEIGSDFVLSSMGPYTDPDYDALDPAVAYNSTNNGGGYKVSDDVMLRPEAEASSAA